MPAGNYNQSEAELTLGLLKAVHEDKSLTQRTAAQELGVALGLVNTYLKRCVNKGLIKVRQVPSRRFAYYLTPKGFAEKSRLTADFLGQSLSLFRQAQHEYEGILAYCAQQKFNTVILYGASDLAEILALYARDYPVKVVGIVDKKNAGQTITDAAVVAERGELGPAKAHVVTSLHNPQKVYDDLVREYSVANVLAPALLEIDQVDDDGKDAGDD